MAGGRYQWRGIITMLHDQSYLLMIFDLDLFLICEMFSLVRVISE